MPMRHRDPVYPSERRGDLPGVRVAVADDDAASAGAPVMIRDRGKSYARQVWETIVVTVALSGLIGVIGYVNRGHC